MRSPGEARSDGLGENVSRRLAAWMKTHWRRSADPKAVAADFLRPGHVFPLSARPGLLGDRHGHSEVTVALTLAAGLPPIGACCEIMRPDGEMAKTTDLEQFAVRWQMPMVDVDDLVKWL